LAAIGGALRSGATFADLALARGSLQETVPQLKPLRLAEPFEALRDAADQYAAHHGAAPVVFVATLGRIADFTARATWVRNLFEVAGFHAPVGDGFADLDALIAAFRASGARLACLAGTDASYAEQASETAQALKAAGCSTLYLAGKPVDAASEAGYRDAGVDGFVHVGIDVVASLSEAQRRAGMAANQTAEG
jgi:methylmalonyl-CoA mutase